VGDRYWGDHLDVVRHIEKSGEVARILVVAFHHTTHQQGSIDCPELVENVARVGMVSQEQIKQLGAQLPVKDSPWWLHNIETVSSNWEASRSYGSSHLNLGELEEE